MRKPLVVACVAAATLGAGLVTASTMAQATPDAPEVPDVLVQGGRVLPEPDEVDFVEPLPTASRPPAKPGRSARKAAAGDVEKGEEKKEDAEKQGEERDEEPAERRPEQDRSITGRQDRPAARPGADPFAAARIAVTAASISASPDAPVQQQVLALVNRNRRGAGCGELTPDRRLIAAANAHAADMAQRGYFAHESPRGDKAGNRVAGAGYEWRRYGENIARGQRTPFEVVDDWMDSPEHRENILDCRLDQMGVGLAIAKDDTPYWVQDFATPR